MAVRKQQLRKNLEGFIDHQGLFHPIRSGEKEKGKNYSASKAGDNDDVFDKEIRKMKNQEKADEIYQKRMMDEALDNALGEESKVSLSQFVRRSGGLKFDAKSNEPYNGELENLSFKQSKVKGIAHPKGKYSLDGMRESADLAGYSTPNGDPLSTINDFLDALQSDLKGKKIYPFGTIGAYKFNPGGRITKAEYLRRQSKNLTRVINKLKKKTGTKTKVAKLENVRELVNKLARGTKPGTETLKKNGLLTAFAELAVGTSAAVGLYDRFKETKEVKPKNSNRDFVGLKDNKGKSISPAQQKTIHERNFQNFLVAIEKGDLSKEPLAKIQGKLAGHEANEVSRAIQYARLTYKLKKNPSVGILKQAENLIEQVKNQLKINGIVGRILARHKAGKLYKRQLRLEAAIDRAKKKRSAAEAKAKKNPAKVLQFPTSKAKPIYELRIGHYGENFLSTNQVLKGRGITLWSDGKDHTRGLRKYKLTDKALKPFEDKLIYIENPAKNPAKNRVQSKSYEAFQGRKPTKQFEMESPEGAPKNLYALGKLFELRLKGKPNLDFRKEVTGKTFYVCSTEANKQLWIVGGKVATPNDSIKAGYSEPFATITHIVYETKKVHLDDKKEQGYIHKFGEDGGTEPVLAFDRNGFPIIVGGSYEITPLGIAD